MTLAEAPISFGIVPRKLRTRSRPQPERVMQFDRLVVWGAVRHNDVLVVSNSISIAVSIRAAGVAQLCFARTNGLGSARRARQRLVRHGITCLAISRPILVPQEHQCAGFRTRNAFFPVAASPVTDSSACGIAASYYSLVVVDRVPARFRHCLLGCSAVPEMAGHGARHNSWCVDLSWRKNRRR